MGAFINLEIFNNMDNNSDILYEKLIFENLEKAFQVRLVVSLFKDVEYIHIRKYFLSFEGEWIPSKEGISIPLTIQNSYALLAGLAEISSKIEESNCISEHFKAQYKNNE